MLSIHRLCGTEPTEKRKTHKNMMVEIGRFKLLRLHFECTSSKTCWMYRAFYYVLYRRLQLFQYHHYHHHHHVQEGLGLIPVPCILKMKLVPPSLPRSSYVSSSFWFILKCLFRYPVCVHPLYVL